MLPRQPQKNWAKLGVLLTLFVGLLAIAVTIILQVSDKTDKYFGLIIIALLGYIVYSEFFKEYPTSRSK